MKKKFFLLTLLGASVLTLASCGEIKEVDFPRPLDGGEPQADWVDYSAPISNISISSNDREIILDNIGLSETVEYSISPRNALKTAVDWVSSNEQIATVSKDNATGEVTVTAVNGGECDITASSGTISDTAHVIVNVPLIDFSLSKESIDLDYGESVDIIPTFEPEYTTFTDLTWTPSDDSITVVGGRVTAGNKTVENGTISVTSPQLNKVVVVTVNITDKWNYVDELTLSSPKTELEIDRSLTISSEVTPIYPDREASTLTNNSIKYISLTPEILSVNESTGEVTAIGTGLGKVKATLFDERKDVEVSSNEIQIEAYEVKATSISIKDYSKQTVSLDNVDVPSITLEPVYVLDDMRADRPSRGEVSFSSADESVATVNDNGVVTFEGKGTTTITMTDSYSNLFDFVTVEVTMHGTSLALSSSLTEAGVNRPITLSTKLTPEDVNDPSITFEAIPSENVEIINHLDGTATAISHEEGLVQFIAKNGSGEHQIVSNPAPVTFKYLFEENIYYLVGTRAFSGYGEGASWDDAKKAAVLEKTEEKPEGYNEQYKVRLELEEGDEFKFRLGPTWIDTISWKDPGEGQEHIRTDHVQNLGAVANGKLHVRETSEGYGNIVVDVDGIYDIYFKTKTVEGEDGYDIYIGDADVFRFEYAPKTVEVGKHVEAKVSDWHESISVTKNNDNIEMHFNEVTGVIDIKGLVVGEKTIISATDADKTISYEISVINQLADFTLAGSFNDWNASDQNYGLVKIAAHEYVKENVHFNAGDELQAVSRETGDFFGNESDWEGCHFSVTPDGYGKNKLIIDETETYNVHIYTDGTKNPIVLVIASQEGPIDPPLPTYEYDWYLKQLSKSWTLDEDVYFTQDTGDANHYYIANMVLTAGDKLQGYNPTTDDWKGTARNHDWWETDSDNNLVVKESGTYYVDLHLDKDNGNYLSLWKDTTIPEFTAVVSADLSFFSGWNASDISLYVWTSDESKPLGSWDDCKNNLASGSVTITATKPVNHFIFYLYQPGDNGQVCKQTVDLTCDLHESGNYKLDFSGMTWPSTNEMDNIFIVVDEQGGGGGDTPVDPQPTTLKTFYFTLPNPGEYEDYGKSWDSLKAYVWNDTTKEGMSGWPGSEMSSAGLNEFGQPVFSITVDTALYDHIIFNSGSYQTKDIAFTEFGDYNACYVSSGAYTNSAQVGFWNK